MNAISVSLTVLCKLDFGSKVVEVGHRKSTLYKFSQKINKRWHMPIKVANSACRGRVEPVVIITKFD